MSFWEHLDVLRGVLLRSAAAWFVCTVAAFVFRNALFTAVLAPAHSDFVFYSMIRRCGIPLEDFDIHFINTELAAQFTAHVEVAACIGLLVSFPLIAYFLYGFLSPALYLGERRYVKVAFGAGSLLFLLGIAVNYFVVFPLSVRFLASYQVSGEVVNIISLSSYIGTLLTLSLCMGVVFELPAVTYILGRMGLLNADIMRRYRRHALVAIVTAAAVITPTTDVFTLAVVTLPIYALYEVSILTVRK